MAGLRPCAGPGGRACSSASPDASSKCRLPSDPSAIDRGLDQRWLALVVAPTDELLDPHRVDVLLVAARRDHENGLDPVAPLRVRLEAVDPFADGRLAVLFLVRRDDAREGLHVLVLRHLERHLPAGHQSLFPMNGAAVSSTRRHLSRSNAVSSSDRILVSMSTQTFPGPLATLAMERSWPSRLSGPSPPAYPQ